MPCPHEQLWIPAVMCPSCGARPALRVSAFLHLAIVRGPVDAAEVLLTYQCRDRYCGVVYDVTAAAIRDARPHEPVRLAGRERRR